MLFKYITFKSNSHVKREHSYNINYYLNKIVYNGEIKNNITIINYNTTDFFNKNNI